MQPFVPVTQVVELELVEPSPFFVVVVVVDVPLALSVVDVDVEVVDVEDAPEAGVEVVDEVDVTGAVDAVPHFVQIYVPFTVPPHIFAPVQLD